MTIFTWGGDIQLYNLLQNIKFFVEDTFKSDVLRSMKEWVNENSASNGLNMEAINNTKKAMYGEEKEAQPTGLLANVENFNKEVNNSVLHTQNPTINPQEVNNSVNLKDTKELKELRNDLEELNDTIEKININSKTAKDNEK